MKALKLMIATLAFIAGFNTAMLLNYYLSSGTEAANSLAVQLFSWPLCLVGLLSSTFLVLLLATGEPR